MFGGKEKHDLTPSDAIQACDFIRARNKSWRHPFGWLECAGCYYVSGRSRLSARGCIQVESYYKRMHRSIRDKK